jgi:hypothetical protein
MTSASRTEVRVRPFFAQHVPRQTALDAQQATAASVRVPIVTVQEAVGFLGGVLKDVFRVSVERYLDRDIQRRRTCSGTRISHLPERISSHAHRAEQMQDRVDRAP